MLAKRFVSSESRKKNKFKKCAEKMMVLKNKPRL